MRTAAAALCLVLGACVVQATQTAPPPADAPAATVYLLSKTGHTGLLLPDGDGRWTEYAFGDHGWYVEERAGVGWSLYTLMADSAGALGRRRIQEPLLEDRFLREREGALYPYRVAVADLDRLRARLDAEYARGGASVYNPTYGLHFVRARAPYSMWFNCADATAEWLRELGIEAPTDGVCKRIRGDRAAALPLPNLKPAAPRRRAAR